MPALWVGSTQVDGPAAGGVSRLRHQRPVRNEGPALGGVLLGQHILHLGLHVPGVRHISLSVRESQLDGLQDLVVGVGAVLLLGQLQPL